MRMRLFLGAPAAQSAQSSGCTLPASLISALMDFELSDEQRAFAETARAFARDEWLPKAPGWDDRGEFPLKGVGEHWELYATTN